MRSGVRYKQGHPPPSFLQPGKGIHRFRSSQMSPISPAITHTAPSRDHHMPIRSLNKRGANPLAAAHASLSRLVSLARPSCPSPYRQSGRRQTAATRRAGIHTAPRAAWHEKARGASPLSPTGRSRRALAPGVGRTEGQSPLTRVAAWRQGSVCGGSRRRAASALSP